MQELDDENRHFQLTAEDFDLINPNTHTLPIFRSKMDAEIAKKVYRRVPVLIDESKGEEGNPWGVDFGTMFHMSNDSHLFMDFPNDDCYPLYEAKMLHQYDHRWATHVSGKTFRDVTDKEKEDPSFEVKPKSWISKKEVYNRIADIPDSVKKAWYAGEEHVLRNALALCGDEELQKLSKADHIWRVMDKVMDERSPKWLMGIRNIARSTDERTFISSFFPRGGLGHSGTVVFGLSEHHSILLLGCFNSLVCDYFARQKIGGINLSLFYIKQFPVVSPKQISYKVQDYIDEQIRKLFSTSYKFASILESEVISWDSTERSFLRAELDAIYARLYGVTREDLMFILDPSSVMGDDYPTQTFPGLKNKELNEYGEYRTMRLVLEAWDRQEKEPELWS